MEEYSYKIANWVCAGRECDVRKSAKNVVPEKRDLKDD